MQAEFGNGISYLREIMNHTREHAKDSDLQAVLQSVEAVKAYFAENLGKDED
jgi:hypothetical protein